MKRLAWVAVALLGACRSAAPGDLPEIRYGRDACSRCGMILSEERFASGYVDREGRTVLFDDLGELLAAAAEEPGVIGLAFVNDLEDGKWVRAAAAYFVRVPALATPMGSGVAAFRDRPRAEAFARARSGGTVLDATAAVREHGARPAGK